MTKPPQELDSACLICHADSLTDRRLENVEDFTRHVRNFEYQIEHLFQVCCVLPDKLPAFNRHQRLLEYSDKDDDTKTRDSDKIPGQGRGQCGRRMTAAKRVVGGTDAAFGSFPWMALVKGGQSRCGGTLVGDRSANIVCTDITCHTPLSGGWSRRRTVSGITPASGAPGSRWCWASTPCSRTVSRSPGRSTGWPRSTCIPCTNRHRR